MTDTPDAAEREKLLLPCPLCGGAVELRSNYYATHVAIVCDACHLFTGEVRIAGAERALLVRTWNRRAPEPARETHAGANDPGQDIASGGAADVRSLPLAPAPSAKPAPQPGGEGKLRDLLTIWRERAEYRMRSARKRLDCGQGSYIEDRAIAETWATAANEAECCMEATPAPAAPVEVSEHAAMAKELAKRIEIGEWLATRVKLFETFASERVCKSVDAAMESRFGASHQRLLAAALAAAGKKA